MGSPAVEKPTHCERFVSASSGIRIVAYIEKRFMAGAWYFVLATNDGGKNWRQLMYNRWDEPLPPPCENIKSRNPNHLWVWMDTEAAITTDGGKTWTLWSIERLKPENRYFISSIEFKDEAHGTMILGRDPKITLHSNDGGKTWL